MIDKSVSPKMRQVPLDALNASMRQTLMEVLGIRIVELTEDFIRGEMPVENRTWQVHGILHGGASVALAETLGSIGASLMVDPQVSRCVGLEINANHVSSVRSGQVIGTARPLHVGRATQVWEIRIHNKGQDNSDPHDGNGRLVCVSRLTVAVLPLAPKGTGKGTGIE